MFFELSKLFNFFLTSPISWILMLLLGGYWFIRSKKRKKWCLIGSVIVLAIFTNKPLVEYVNCWMAKEYNAVDINTTQHYKIAIIMGGFASMNEETKQIKYEQNRAGRLWEAVRLWRKGKVERILITGDLTSAIQSSGGSTANLFLQYMEEMGVPRKIFILEQQARNTHENAVYTAEILKKQKVKSSECILITSATHMGRSLKCFAKTGVHPDFLSVNIDKPTNINYKSFYPHWEVAIKWQELINEWAGNLAYWVMGYI